MQHTWTIAGRQFRSYFNGPVAYIVVCIVLLALGYFFWPTFFLAGVASGRAMFSILSTIIIFAVPAMTMGLIAEEKRTGTIELLVTMPVGDGEVVLGKFFGVLGLYAVLLLLTLPYVISIGSLGNLDWGPVFTGYLGLLLQGAALIGLGLFASSITDNQLVAFFVALAVSVPLWIIHFRRELIPAAILEQVEWFTFGYHFESLSRGVLDLRDILYFLSVAGIGLGLSFAALDSRRWS